MHQVSKCTSAGRTANENASLAACTSRHPCEIAKLNSVSESLKSRNRIYELARTESEIRVNDYNPCSGKLQFVSESSGSCSLR